MGPDLLEYLVPLAITFAIIIAFILIERSLRQDTVSSSLAASSVDRGTTWTVGAAFGASWLLLALSIVANHFAIGLLKPTLLFHVIGFTFMLAGLAIRVVAARTLGKFYSRTLLVREDQRVISEGIYRSIRHPGYLGDMILFVFAGLSTSNYIATALIALVVVPAYLKRISAEEMMLSEKLGTKYEEYKLHTRRLIPFLY
jgi:protein-S-isoprenylcysteine O-methyltransferase Ste14